MKNLLLLFITLFTLSTQAQMAKNRILKKGKITGQVIDKTSGEGLPYVNIIVKETNNTTHTGGITDDNGFFEIKGIDEGKKIVEVQFIGFKTISFPFELTKDNKYHHPFGKIILEEESTSLDEVVVVAETSSIVQKVDRKVINVGKDLTSAGATASEILNNVPSISVDSQSGEISLRGNNNVRILIDGKPTNISASQLLQQIPSTSIKSIELITNPSAKYNPEGMSGIINVILHKNANMGFNGTLNLGYTRGKNNRFNGSLDLNYKINKVNFFANYGSNTGKNDNDGYVNRLDDNSRQDFDMVNDRTSHLIKTGVDYYINDKNTLSFFTTQNFYNRENTSDVGVSYFSNPNLNYTQFNTSENDSHSQTYNLNYELDFEKEGHNIEFEINYNENDAPEDAVFSADGNQSNNTNLNYVDHITNKSDNTIINLDYTNPISEKLKLELGLESRIQNSANERNTTQEENNIPIGLRKFNFDRTINSVYINTNYQFSEKLGAQIGLRFERFDMEIDFEQNNQRDQYKEDYTTLYPSAFFTYNPSEKNQFQLGYSKRVERPGIDQVNPIREFSTPRIVSVGNPELEPQFTNSIEFNYTRSFGKGSITGGTFYRRISDNIIRTLRENPEDRSQVILSYNNVDFNENYGVEISSNYRVTNWYNFNASFDLYNNKEQGEIEEIINDEVTYKTLTVDNIAYSFYMNNNFKATKNLRFQLFGMYRGQNKSIQFDVKEMWKMDVGARYNILKGKGTISARMSDIFNTMRFAFDSENPFPQNGQFKWESQTAYLGFMYRFGGGKNRAKNRKRRDSGESSGGGSFM